MRKFIRVAASAVALFAMPALAADKAADPVALPIEEAAVGHDWGGLYAGAHVGFNADDTDAKLAGVHLTYLSQRGQLVIGIEGSASVDPMHIDTINKDSVLLSASGLAGLSFGRVMVYGKISYSIADKLDGLGYGAGINFALAERIVIGIEAMRTDFGPVAGQMDTVTVRAGYRF